MADKTPEAVLKARCQRYESLLISLLEEPFSRCTGCGELWPQSEDSEHLCVCGDMFLCDGCMENGTKVEDEEHHGTVRCH